jgi:hypothetical protein
VPQGVGVQVPPLAPATETPWAYGNISHENREVLVRLSPTERRDASGSLSLLFLRDYLTFPAGQNRV